MTPRLSILIPSIPSRWDKARNLFDHLQELVGDKDVEILMLSDNKKRTIGEKREALKNAANGKYFMFVDDDDSLYSIDEIYAATGNDVDVITFKSLCRNSDGSTYIVTAGLKYEVEHNTEDGRYLDCKRPPFTQSAWASRFKEFKFPAFNYSEDWEWVRQCLPTAFLETHIPLVLHGYNFDPEVSEASIDNGNVVMFSTNSTDFSPMVCTNESFKSEGHSNCRRCIVNLATSKFWGGQERLRQSLVGYDVITFQHETQINAPLHTDNPYAFKIYAIESARDKGYDQVLWLDASVYAVNDPKPVFDWIDKHGYFMEEAGHYVGQWCNDQTLAFFGITREKAMTMPMFSAGFVGLDFRSETAVTFFSRWKNAMLNGMFKGDWSNHRHDLTCGSIIANQMGLVSSYSPGGNFFAYIGPGYGEPKESVVFHLKGQP